MKKMMFLTTIISASLWLGCTKLKNLADINVDIPYSTTVNVPVVDGYSQGIPLPAGGLVLEFPRVGVETNSRQYLDQYHTSSSKIRNVYIKSLSLNILTPPSQSFDFIDTVQFFVSTKTLTEILVAYQYNIPKGATSLNFNTNTDVNLTNYFLADTIYMRMRGHINAIPASGTQLKASTVFHLVANPLY